MMEMPAENTTLPKTLTLESPGIHALSQPPQYKSVLQPAPAASKAESPQPLLEQNPGPSQISGAARIDLSRQSTQHPTATRQSACPMDKGRKRAPTACSTRCTTFWFGIHRKFSICQNLNNLNDKDYHSNVVTTASPPPSPSALSWKKLCLGHAPAFQRALPARAGWRRRPSSPGSPAA